MHLIRLESLSVILEKGDPRWMVALWISRDAMLAQIMRGKVDSTWYKYTFRKRDADPTFVTCSNSRSTVVKRPSNLSQTGHCYLQRLAIKQRG